MSDDKLRPMLFARLNHVVGFAQAGCHRFFAQNPFDARFCGGDRNLGAYTLPRYNTHDVQVLLLQQFVVVGINRRDGEILGEFGSRILVDNP